MINKYYTAETDAAGYVNNSDMWKATTARSLTAAKCSATRRQTFQGTAVHVGERCADGICAVAVRRGDAIDMNVRGIWFNYDPEPDE